DSGGLTSSVQFAPGDSTVLARFKAHQATNPNLDDTIWDGSYVYPPTFWLSPSRYQTNAVVSVGPQHLRRNRYDEVTFPQAKVMRSERFDFSTRSRRGPNGRMPRSPPWNNPEAGSRFSRVDGSVDTVPMRRIYELANSTNAAESEIFTPSGTFNPSQAMMR